MSRANPRAAALAALLAAGGLCAYLLYLAGVAPGGSALYERWLYGALFVLAAVLLAVRALAGGPERRAWGVFAVATIAHLGGWVPYWLFVAGDPSPDYPSVADAGWLLAYVLNYYALVLLLRARSVRFHGVLWIDGAIVVLAVAALSGAIVVDRVLESTGGSMAAVLTSGAYPLADLAVVAVVVTVFALSGWRPGRSWVVIGLSFAMLAVADSVYLYQTASGTWAQGALLDVAWPLAALLLATAAWMPDKSSDELELEGWRTLLVPGAAALLAIGVLVYGTLAEIGFTGTLLATATLVVVTVRSVIAFRDMLALAERHERALDAALRDHLTGLHNHRAFHESLGAALFNGETGDSPVCLILLDLVGLKATNDTYGHQAGDERLRLLAARLLNVLRAGDGAFRVGGDEFAILLPGVQAWDGFHVAERLQRALTDADSGEGPAVAVGVAEAGPGLGKDELVGRADRALVEAKRSHRKIVLYSADLDLVPDPASGSAAHTKTLATALARAVDAKDSYTRSHCETVSEICVLIAEQLGLPPERVSQLRLAGLLHDVGKIGIPDTVLQKPGPLTPSEWAVMTTHSALGHSIVSGAGLRQEAEWILRHHERPDGRGYPDGLSGEAIPLESRLILVADAFEAMTSDRPYRRGRPEAEALAQLRAASGTQFDPDCVAALEQALERRADVAGGVEQRRGHDPEEQRGGGEQHGGDEHLGLGTGVGLG